MIQIKRLIPIALSLYSAFTFATNLVPINDTIILDMKHVEGRWIEKSTDKKPNIYIFRDDNTFHKATDNGELLFFNVAGKYKLSNDSIQVFYQDFSRQTSGRVKVRTMYLQVVSLSDEELNINKTENNKTEFIRLRRKKTQ